MQQQEYILESPTSLGFVFPPNLVHSGTGDPTAIGIPHKCNYNSGTQCPAKNLPDKAIISIYVTIGPEEQLEESNSLALFPEAAGINAAAPWSNTSGQDIPNIPPAESFETGYRTFQNFYDACYNHEGLPCSPAHFEVADAAWSELRGAIMAELPAQIGSLQAVWVHEKEVGRGKTKTTKACYGDCQHGRWLVKMTKAQQEATIKFLESSLDSGFTTKPSHFLILVRFPGCPYQQLHADFRR
jgi:hypothetical protein